MDATQPPPDDQPPAGRSVSARAVIGALVLGAVIGGMAVEYWMTRSTERPSAQTTPASGDVAADVAYLKKVLATQSHTMQDVGNFWALLWFAADKKNWPLAKYFFDEARQAVRWTVLIRPVRQMPGGGTIDIKGIFDAVDPSAFATVQLAIEDQDHEAFVAAYKQALDACHTCHTSAGLPQLRPVVPTAPPTTVLGFDAK